MQKDCRVAVTRTKEVASLNRSAPSRWSARQVSVLLLAVVIAFQAQEMVIEAGIRAGLRRQGVGDVEITERLKGCLSTKERLTTFSRGALGGRFSPAS